MENHIDPSIFRAYDIRGNSKKNLNPALAYKIGYYLAKTNLEDDNSQICVGRDGRLSSDSLYQGLIKGLAAAGAKIVSIGIVPSPLLYYADYRLKPALSIMVTGSHNPKDDNGFKIVKKGQSYYGERLQSLYQDILSNSLSVDLNEKIPEVEEISLDEEYTNNLLQGMNIRESLKVAWDPGNGAGGEIVKLLKAKLPNQNLIINQEIDGNFPKHHPDPTVPENLQELIELVEKEKCDLGVAFDGDADRIGIVTNDLRIIWGDQMLCIIGEDILKEHPGASIIADVKASNIFFKQINKHGGNPIMCRTGHAFIKAKLKETNALLAGEMSGHIFFADRYFGFDDALYAAIRFLELLSKQEKSIGELVDHLPKIYNSPEIRIEVSEEYKFTIIDEIKSSLNAQNLPFNDLDGIRYENDVGWWLLRASNTQNALIARCESSSIEGLEVIKHDLLSILKIYNLSFINE